MRILESVLEACLLVLPGRSGLQDFQREDPDGLARNARILIPRIYKKYPDFFPLSGVIRRRTGGLYLEIDDKSNYTTFAAAILNVSERRPPINASGGTVAVFPPTGPLGTHIALRDPGTAVEGRIINFRLGDAITSVASVYGGTRPSAHDSTLFPITRYILVVDGIPPELVDPLVAPHIHLATMGLRRT